jgi:hypothetical protein
MRMARRGPKHVVTQGDIITSIKKLSVAIAGICLKDSYVYITQQDAPHKYKMLNLLSDMQRTTLVIANLLK